MGNSNRKQNYVDNHVQGSLLRRIMSHWLVFFGVCGFAIIALQSLLGDPELPIGDRLQQQAGEFVFVAIVMLALFPAFMLDTIRFSNRFVGPIARLRRHMRQLAEGEIERCAFRGDDFWKDMADEFNLVAEAFEAKQQEIDELRAQLGHPAGEPVASTSESAS